MLKSRISALFLMFCACTLLGAYMPLDKIHNNPEYNTNEELVNNVETSTNNERGLVDDGCKRHCGVITKKNNASFQPKDGKAIFLDRFGNVYAKEELSVDRSMMKCPDAGYFALEFLPGFTPEEEATICQVFTDVSALITPQSQLLDIAIPIRVGKDNLESGAYGAATAFYRADLPSGGCGIEQNMVWEHINTSADFDHFLQTGDVAGEYIVNSNLGSENSWHTLDMDNNGDFDDPQVASGNVDLYSVTLHEVMHMLGFTSRITPDGSPLNGFYSFWDQQLFSDISASPAPSSSPLPFIVPVANDPDCCDAHEYNSGIGAAPSALNLECNSGSQAPAFYQFGPNSADVATVFGDYAPGVINDPLDEMINILSHLNSECDGAEYYVMDSGFGTGEDRRILTDTELAILCNLGYDLNPIEANVTICEPACHVVAMDHFITIPSDAVGNDIQVILTFSNLIANGYVPSSNYTIVVTDVDPFANILIEDVPDGVRVSNMQPGYSYSLQYSITIDDVLCQACDEGNITIIVEMDGNDTTVPTIVDCDNIVNLLPWGDFESFPAEGTEGFLSTYNLPICDPLGINTILSQNSPGVVTASSSQMGYLRGKIAGDNQSTTNCESIYFPLSKPISPGCTASFSLDYRTHYNFLNGDVGNLQVYFSHSQPCVMPEYADCGTPDPVDGFQCVESGIEIWSPISSPITHNGTPWTNNTPHEITYIVISNNANAIYSGTTGQGSAPVLIDNIIVTQECANTLSVTPTVQAECYNGGIIVDYEVCLSGTDTAPRDVDLTLSIPNVPGVSFGNGDFSGPQLTVGGVEPGAENCQTVRLILDTQGSVLGEGNEFDISLDATAYASCFEGPVETSLTLSSCTSNCKTPEAGFTYTSDCEAGTFTLTANDPSGLHNWTVNGVDYFGNPLTLPILDLASNDTYTIEHSVLNECLETDAEIRDILITSCTFTCPCEGPNAINIKAGNGTSFTAIEDLDPLRTTGPDGEILAAQDYCISLVGKLLIDNEESNTALYDLIFEVGELRMNPGAEIIIGEYANVSISGADDGVNASEIYGCDYMWSGIIIENEASLELQHLLIQDAQHAVKLNDNSTLQVDNNTFSRNFIGIYHLDDSEISITEYSNTFDGNAPLLPPYNEFLVPPYQIQARSAAGIFFRSIGSGAQATCFFGSDSEPASIYRDLPVGISGYGNANIEIKNSEFTNIWSTAGVDYPIEGIAVNYKGFLQSASSIAISGAAGNIQPVFENCQTAVEIDRGAVSITNTQVSECETGFSVSNVIGRPLDISDNELVFFDTGIELTDNDDASNFTVSNNVMKKVLAYGSLAYGGNGISIDEELGRTGSNYATVQGNTIHLAAGLEGAAIFANESSNLRILDNAPIQLRRSSNDIGINMVNGIGNLVDGNEIYNLPNAGEPGSRTGLRVENTTKTTYSCNNFYELHTGVRFVAGDCSDTDFQNNYFQPPMAYGLYYEDGLTINTQEWHANRWDGKASFYTEYAAYNEITPANDNEIIAQRYLVHSPSNGFFPPSIHLPNYGGSEPWFVLDNSGSIPLCQTGSVVPPGGGKVLNEGNTSISQLMHVFPNPVRDLLTIDLSLSESADLLIMNNLGQVMLKDRLDAGHYSKQIDVSSFAEGVYYIQLITRDANNLSQKVVVLH